MSSQSNSSQIPLPTAWPKRVPAAVLQVISLAQFTLVYSRSCAVNSQIDRVRLKAMKDQLKQYRALLREKIRIKYGRIAIIYG